uniref:gap junction alpha-5 protein-like isoform X2 n=1 Tax=Ciona intestinalis TaxID=7719 RepID=UPI000EF48C76|nr:gap junction alpha-5 protein-like isoform X2 [Ciona intestinalis]|eukprot:XP_026696438.1 gap junction alpha-5 protein-like isoform X2 [Ciona intestinalis]
MWNILEKVSEQVSLYATLTGQVWYLLVYLFRLIVVVTIGSSVYSDEQSAFRCSTKVIGCDNVCYDKFAKISHIRFWAFQLLALSAPVIVFHFYTIHVKGRIEKLKVKEQEAIEREEQYQKELTKTEDTSKWGVIRNSVNNKIQRRKSRIGKVRPKKVYANTQLEEITLTRGIKVAYFLSVLTRFVMEIIFLFLAYDLFRFAEYPHTPNDGRIVSDGKRVAGVFDLFWIRVPQLYRCGGDSVRWACGQHMLPDGYKPKPILKTPSIGTVATETESPASHPRPTTPPTETSTANTETSPKELLDAPRKESGSKHTAIKGQRPSNRSDLDHNERRSITMDDLKTAILLARRRKPSQPPATRRPSKNNEHSSRKTHFQIPYGTQSLNRPKKVTKMPYRSMYRVGSISFSHSEAEDDEESEGSDESAERVSVSEHSETEYV